MISLGSLFNRQPAALLGLDISSSSVKLVELGRDREGQYVLERCAIEPLERGAITDGNVEKFDEVAEAIRRAPPTPEPARPRGDGKAAFAQIVTRPNQPAANCLVHRREYTPRLGCIDPRHLAAGEALNDDLGVFVDENGHWITPSPL